MSNTTPVDDWLIHGEGFMRSASSYMTMLNRDGRPSGAGVNRTARDSVKDGFRAVADGFCEGVKGMIARPSQGAKKDGVKGAVVGFFKGLGGLVTKPLAGVLEGGAGVIGGVRKALDDEMVIPRIRIPCAFPMARVVSYSKTEAEMQYRVARGHHKESGERLLACLRDQATGVWLVVCDKRLVLFEGREIKHTWGFGEIERVAADGKRVIVGVSNRRSLMPTVYAANAADAEGFAALLRSSMTFDTIFAAAET